MKLHPVTGKKLNVSASKYQAMTTAALIREYDKMMSRRCSSSNIDGGFYTRCVRLDLVLDLIEARANKADETAEAFIQATM